MAAIVAQCPSCRALVAIDRIVVEGERAGVRCPSCFALSWLPIERTNQAALPSPALVVDLPLPALPAPALPAPAVALVAAAPGTLQGANGFDDDVVARISAKLLPPADDAPRQAELAARFSRLLQHWHNETEHKQLLKAAAASDELAFIGTRYRAVLDIVRDEPRARAAQQDLIALAMANMGSTRALTTDDGASNNNVVKLVAGVVLAIVTAVGIGVGAQYMTRSFEKAAAIE